MMKINQILSVFILMSSFFSTISFAEKYQFSGNVGVLRETLNLPFYFLETDAFPNADLDMQAESSLFGVTAYAKAVDTQKGPLAEAAFLSKSSFLNVQGERIEVEYAAKTDLYKETLQTSDVNTVLVSGRAVVPYAGRSMIVDVDVGGGDVKTANLGVGTYVASAHKSLHAIVVNYAQMEVDGSEESSNILSIDLKGVQDLNNGTFIASDTAIQRHTEYSEIRQVTYLLKTGLDYYFNRQLSAGFIGDFFTGDKDGFSYGVRGSFFPVEFLKMSAYFSHIDYTDYAIDQEVFGLELEVRL